MSVQGSAPSFPPDKKPDHIIPETSFAGPYRSTVTNQAQQPLLDLLGHVNCSYLSSSNHRAVTLEDLKQHVHSLTVLIRNLGVSTTHGAVDSGGNGDDHFVDGEVFDWLNDLSTPYTNKDESHVLPLTSLQNQLLQRDQAASEQEHADKEYRYACPLMRSDVDDKTRHQVLPLATHELLVKHANDVLERLDHEFSSSGGLMGILPVTGFGHEEIRQMGEKTLLGQWIAFTRSLVLRCHDLERSYANALDVVAGEAFVPREIYTDVGSVGLKGKVVSYEQDRFVLCNVLHNQWRWLNERLSAEEQRQQERNVASLLAFVEVPTRYYRLNGQPTVFVVPQWEGTNTTTQIEARPTVVQVVKPVYGNRASAWEQKHEAEMHRLRMYEPELERLIRENRELKEDVLVMAQERKAFEVERRLWHAAAENSLSKTVEETTLLSEQIEDGKKELQVAREDFEKQKNALVDMQLKAEKWIEREKEKWRIANPLEYSDDDYDSEG